MDEISFFENKNVIVTQTRFIVSFKVYEIKNISTVRLGVINHNVKWYFLAMTVGFLLLFLSQGRIPGVILFVSGFILLYLKEDKYSVRIRTEGGETDSLISENRVYVEKVIKAINEAMWALEPEARTDIK